MYYYVGQKVSHQGLGDGEVININDKKHYQVRCSFNGKEVSFTKCGRFMDGDKFPSLSQQPHVPLELKEIVTFESGELVWVKDEDDKNWQARYFSNSIGCKHYAFLSQGKSGEIVRWDEIRKFSDIPF